MKKYPPPCSVERSVELRRLLKLLAKRTTEEGTLGALGTNVHTLKFTISRWIRVGEVPPYKARDLLQLPNANPEGEEPITIQQLTPSLF